MKTLVEQFNEQMKDAIRIGQASQITIEKKAYRNVVIAGMGGSGIGGSVVQSILLDKLPVPVSVVKTYNIPGFVNQDTLFIACSFSGNTEETLAGMEEAQQKGATIVCVTTGGQMLKLAQEHKYPTIVFPGETKMPRANIGYSAFQLFFVLEAAGLIDNSYLADLHEAVALVEETETAVREEAQVITGALYERLPIVYGDALLESTAVRFQQQVNENSKQLCHVNSFPEMNHNEIVGWEFPTKILTATTVLFLHSAFDHKRVAQRMELCRPVFEAQGAKVLDVTAKGKSLTAQIFYLIHLLDWVSIYLAEKNGTDPAPVKVIDKLKNQLSAQPA
ncbi:hypothetical protein PK28_03310 [Hymenobacter sp. DG25B]|uniref:bifunctional phosphoglucose/phosphomannose isomerase n=1 Tax=Hymenobacter sp. DG25B TaxID=1385664 RepID=UPI0005412650|nr:bifunctional phosphoglucose/phosphomannose isomerase [Hymenobacter sp. DG25B]AIZ62957.1 hypothetical protein PK28_03310 [Hymenobacter sp. DG25B]